MHRPRPARRRRKRAKRRAARRRTSPVVDQAGVTVTVTYLSWDEERQQAWLIDMARLAVDAYVESFTAENPAISDAS
jgi:hypothetical protein